jgi:elongation factor Ts
MEITAAQVKELRDATGAGMMDCKRALAESGADFDKAVMWLREKGMAKAAKRASKVASEGAVVSCIADDGRSGAVAEVNCETDFVARGDEFRGFAATVCAQALAAGAGCDSADALLDQPSVKDASRTLRDAVSELTGKCGEKVSLRRFARFALADGDTGAVVTYIHMGGKIGVLAEVGCEKAEGLQSEAFRAFASDLCLQICAANPRWVNSSEVPQADYDNEMALYVKQAMETGKPEAVCKKIAEGKMSKYYSEVCLLDQPFVKDDKRAIKDLVSELTGKCGGKISVRGFVRFQLGEGIEKQVSNLAEEVAAELAKAEGK